MICKSACMLSQSAPLMVSFVHEVCTTVHNHITYAAIVALHVRMNRRLLLNVCVCAVLSYCCCPYYVQRNKCYCACLGLLSIGVRASRDPT